MKTKNPTPKMNTTQSGDLAAKERETIERYRRTVNYLAATQIYLQDNPFRTTTSSRTDQSSASTTLGERPGNDRLI